MHLLTIIDLIGTGVFAISGAMAAYEKKLDIFGIAAVAFITALGGGTLRDILIGSTPVAWMKQPVYLLIVAIGLSSALIFKPIVLRLKKTLFLFDTIGISVFTILGLQKALNIGLSPVIAIMMGMVSAVFGGVIRDIVCNEIPLIFRKEIYALTCLCGGILYIILERSNLDQPINILITVCFIAAFRILAVKFKWQLPDIS